MAKKLQLISPLKGEPGDPGVYVGSTEPTDPSVQVWVNPSDSEVTAIPAPATAQVGQTIVVKEVDSDGKPVKWECADVGGGETWEELFRTVIETDAVLDLDALADGTSIASLKLKRCKLILRLPKVETASPGYTYAKIGDTKVTLVQYDAITSVERSQLCVFDFSKIVDGVWDITYQKRRLEGTAINKYDAVNARNVVEVSGELTAFTTSIKLPIETEVVLYGVR